MADPLSGLTQNDTRMLREIKRRVIGSPINRGPGQVVGARPTTQNIGCYQVISHPFGGTTGDFSVSPFPNRSVSVWCIRVPFTDAAGADVWSPTDSAIPTPIPVDGSGFDYTQDPPIFTTSYGEDLEMVEVYLQSPGDIPGSDYDSFPNFAPFIGAPLPGQIIRAIDTPGLLLQAIGGCNTTIIGPLSDFTPGFGGKVLFTSGEYGAIQGQVMVQEVVSYDMYQDSDIVVATWASWSEPVLGYAIIGGSCQSAGTGS